MGIIVIGSSQENRDAKRIKDSKKILETMILLSDKGVERLLHHVESMVQHEMYEKRLRNYSKEKNLKVVVTKRKRCTHYANEQRDTNKIISVRGVEPTMEGLREFAAQFLNKDK